MTTLTNIWNAIVAAAPVVNTALMTAFTFLVWLLQKRMHDAARFATLRICADDATFNQSDCTVHAETLLQNTAMASAVVVDWSVMIRDGDYQENVTQDAPLATTLLKAPKYLSGRGWVITHDTPTALSITTKVSKQSLSSAATVEVVVTYAGGRREDESVSSVINIRQQQPARG